MIDRFLVMSALDNVELCQLLSILDSSLVLTHGSLNAPCDVHGHRSAVPIQSSDRPKGLLDMGLDNSIKLELCHIFHHLADIQMRNRVNEVISFAEEYTNFVQRVFYTLLTPIMQCYLLKRTLYS